MYYLVSTLEYVLWKNLLPTLPLVSGSLCRMVHSQQRGRVFEYLQQVKMDRGMRTSKAADRVPGFVLKVWYPPKKLGGQ